MPSLERYDTWSSALAGPLSLEGERRHDTWACALAWSFPSFEHHGPWHYRFDTPLFSDWSTVVPWPCVLAGLLSPDSCPVESGPLVFESFLPFTGVLWGLALCHCRAPWPRLKQHVWPCRAPKYRFRCLGALEHHMGPGPLLAPAKPLCPALGTMAWQGPFPMSRLPWGLALGSCRPPLP